MDPNLGGEDKGQNDEEVTEMTNFLFEAIIPRFIPHLFCIPETEEVNIESLFHSFGINLR